MSFPELRGKIQSFALATVHGDFIYTDKYSVPFKFVHTSVKLGMGRMRHRVVRRSKAGIA